MDQRTDTSPGDLIRVAREERDMTQGDLARAVGTKQQTIDKIEKGTIKHSRFLHPISMELSIPYDRLTKVGRRQNDLQTKNPISDKELRSDRADLPVQVAAEGGPGEIIVSSDPVDYVQRPAPLANVRRAYGLIIVGQSMVPAYEPGDTALINPNLPTLGGHTYVFYAVRPGEDRATIKWLVRASAEHWHVQQWNPKRQFKLSRREWAIAHRVVGRYCG